MALPEKSSPSDEERRFLARLPERGKAFNGWQCITLNLCRGSDLGLTSLDEVFKFVPSTTTDDPQPDTLAGNARLFSSATCTSRGFSVASAQRDSLPTTAPAGTCNTRHIASRVAPTPSSTPSAIPAVSPTPVSQRATLSRTSHSLDVRADANFRRARRSTRTSRSAPSLTLADGGPFPPVGPGFWQCRNRRRPRSCRRRFVSATAISDATTATSRRSRGLRRRRGARRHRVGPEKSAARANRA